MALAPGTRLGVYEILTPIGAGGMGEVYQATDTRLKRDVALKVLPDHFAQDPDRLARFQREAELLATLNHPHIAGIYGLEESNGVRALVLELVEGPTLADRIAKGPIPLDDALPIARQIAEALEAAHEKGVIHRDLKPANVKITSDGSVKVLDFGLAKLAEAPAVSGEVGVSQSPTITTPAMMTGVGTILGTAAYMSPEQAKGRPADKRSDVWAFGCVLYEMLTGKRAFEGEDVSDTLAAILRGEPDWTLLPADVSLSIRTLVQRCLEKDRRNRIADISTARFVMNEPAIAGLTVGSARALSASQRPLWRRLAPIGVVAIMAAALTGIAMHLAGRTSPAPAVTRFALILPEGQQFSGLGRRFIAISPDGSQVIYAGNGRLYLRGMTDFEPRAIQGTETTQGVTSPVFSPDGRDVAFYSGADQTLKRIAIAGGVAITICHVEAAPLGMTWTHDSIMFGQTARGILRVSSNGGKPESLISIGRLEAFLGPQMLPGDQAVLFTVAAGGDLDNAQIAVQSLASGQRKTLTEGSDARYLTTGHIVYWLRGTIFAVAFDASRLQLVGAPVPVVQGVLRPVGSGAANFSVSETGSLIYVPGPTNASSLRSAGLVLVDRNGHEEALMVPPAPYEVSRFSPDGKQVAVGTDDGKEANIWVYQISGTSSIRQITFGGRNRYPVWAANGERIAFQSDREGAPGIFWQRADGTDTAERLTKPDEGTSHVPESWSQPGERLSFSATSSGSAAETATPTTLWTISVKDKKAVPFGDIRSRTALNSMFSPDGRWLAYTLRSSRATVNVQPFPPTGARYQIRDDAHHPMWSADGKELFYLGSGSVAGITGVSFTLQPSPAFGIPVTVTGSGRFRATYGGPRTYDVAPDGKSFITVGDATPTESGVPAAPQIRVVLNWTEELKAHVPVK